MTRRDLLALPLALVQPLTRDGEADIRPHRYELTHGVLKVNAPDGEPYFAIGQFALMPPPDGVPAMRLREEVGKKGSLIWERDPEPLR